MKKGKRIQELEKDSGEVFPEKEAHSGSDDRFGRIALLLFGSGMCALIYQTVWMREFRLIFGVSTHATSAVLAIFMGGLGFGGIYWGRRVESHPNPLKLYGLLEMGITFWILIYPLLMWMIEKIYFSSGGSFGVGLFGGTLLRFLLAVLVMGIPTFLMGGTLPAVAKCVETDEDIGRRRVAVVYGANTLGSVIGVISATFFLFETIGCRLTLGIAWCVNLLVGFLAFRMASFQMGSANGESELAERDHPERPAKTSLSGQLADFGGWPPRAPGTPPSLDGNSDSPWLIYVFSGAVGFVFFLMEIVWYRMLSPILGGSTYTFGLILSGILLGIGLGSFIFSFRDSSRKPRIRDFSILCALETLFIALPFSAGDNMVVITCILNPIGYLGFPGRVFAWAVIVFISVFPASLVSGIQFPLLIAILGKGKDQVGRQTGLVLAWNTFGAILGALAGGFFLLPALTAAGCWKLAAVLLGIAAFIAAIKSIFSEKELIFPAFSIVVCLACGFLLSLEGPTAAWRHGGITSGNFSFPSPTKNSIEDWLRSRRRAFLEESDGVESSVGVENFQGMAFSLNGKVDGNAILDESTQVMLGLVSAILHPNPVRSLVIGLGTGSSAGWLGKIASMKKVDVVELEPNIVKFARRCGPVNGDLFKNPKINIMVGDGREVLMTSSEEYDLIVSEPSNPYRAGIANLYTKDFYQAAAKRLGKGGMFSQWIQAYEIDISTFNSIYVTLNSVFPQVSLWRLNPSDLLFVCSMENQVFPVSELRKRIQSEPFSSALENTWRASDLEGFFARFIANPRYGRFLSGLRINQTAINTDDKTIVEYGFARSVGKRQYPPLEIFNLCPLEGADQPDIKDGSLDPELVQENRFLEYAFNNQEFPKYSIKPSKEQEYRIFSHMCFLQGTFGGVLDGWKRQDRIPYYPLELSMVGEALADNGDEAGTEYIEKLMKFHPAEAHAIRARLQYRLKKFPEALGAFQQAFREFQSDPWLNLLIMERAMNLAVDMASRVPESAQSLFQTLQEPFCQYALNEKRLFAVLNISRKLDTPCKIKALKQFEPHVPWNSSFLEWRETWYKEAGDSLAKKAGEELREFKENLGGYSFVRALLSNSSN